MVIDTSILIRFLRATYKDRTYFGKIQKGAKLYVSVITVFELYMGANSSQQEFEIQDVLSKVEILPLTSEIAIDAGKTYNYLQRMGQTVEFRDVMIGVTALYYKLPVKTENTNHFSRIKGLILIE